MYAYKMVQIPPNISVNAKEHKGNEAAAYLEGVVNDYAKQGWDFYRVDMIGVNLKPGCLGVLSGKQMEHNHYFVITFRRER